MIATMDGPKMARNDLAVKLDADVAKKAKHVAINRGITLAEYLSELVRPLVERDFKDEMSKMLSDASKTRTKGSR
jgi:hypothetical protein